ncbi:hypothetical protein [Streptomyces fradiae]|uniref:hypothetical protein n=1 Tax=Streptomyces fradiae TaxID=1906 RepID=UPI00398863F8
MLDARRPVLRHPVLVTPRATPNAPGTYLYWSARRIEKVAQDNGIQLDRFRRWSLTSPSVPFVPQLQLGNSERTTRTRYEVAQKISRALGDRPAKAFTMPPPAPFAAGTGTVEFARYIGADPKPEVLLHTRTQDAAGRRVDVVMFGSLDNTEFRTSDTVEDGWTSSAFWAVRNLLASKGREHGWGDGQEMGMEALKIALQQGSSGPDTNPNDPSSRGFTLARAQHCQWCAVVYLDVELDHDRWFLENEAGMEDAHRIVVGAPLWARTGSGGSLTRYWPRRRRSLLPWRNC